MNKRRDWLYHIDPDLDAHDIPEPSDFEEGPSFFYQEIESVLRKHFGGSGDYTDENFAWMVHYLVFDQAHSLEEFWPPEKVLSDIAKLRACLLKAKYISESLPSPIDDAIREAAVQASGALDRGKETEIDPWTDSSLEASPSWKAYLATGNFFRLIDDYIPFLDAAAKKAAEGAPQGKKAIEAWRLVDATVGLCDRNPGTVTVPKSMNEAGPFYRLLVDLFDLFEIEESPVSAFRGWKRFVGR